MAEERAQGELKEAVKEMREIAGKLAEGLERVGHAIASEKIPWFARNLVLLSTCAIAIYTVAYSVASMIPYFAQGLAQVGVIIGYAIPLLFMFMLLSIAVSIAKLVL